jgi:hypothetical protein
MPVQYADFAAWQQGWLQGDDVGNSWPTGKTTWPMRQPVNLPTDLPRPKLQSTRPYPAHPTAVPAISHALRHLQPGHNSTLFMTLFAAYNVLLYRYSQQDDIVVGTPIANRNHPGIENLIGFFVNMLPLRTRISRARFHDAPGPGAPNRPGSVQPPGYSL